MQPSASYRILSVASGSDIDAVLIGFDFGRGGSESRSATITGRARPLTALAADNERAGDQLSCSNGSRRGSSVGIPRHPDDTPHEMTARCEKFARQLEGRYRLAVERVDERYSAIVVKRRPTSTPPRRR